MSASHWLAIVFGRLETYLPSFYLSWLYCCCSGTGSSNVATAGNPPAKWLYCLRSRYCQIDSAAKSLNFILHAQTLYDLSMIIWACRWAFVPVSYSSKENQGDRNDPIGPRKGIWPTWVAPKFSIVPNLFATKKMPFSDWAEASMPRNYGDVRKGLVKIWWSFLAIVIWAWVRLSTKHTSKAWASH